MRKYDELMEQVKLTDEARTRILEHIQTADVTADHAPKVRSLPPYRNYLAAAACVAILLLGAVTVPERMKEDQPQKPFVGEVQVLPDFAAAASAEELSELVGFPVEELEELPFEAADVTYTAYAKTIAEIKYSAGDQSATFRKSMGNGDNSGCYDSYAVQEPFESGTYTGTLKGNVEDEFTLAVWTDDEASYSLYLTQARSKAEWMNLIGG